MYKNYPIPSREAPLPAFAQTTAINRTGRRRRLLFVLAAVRGLQLFAPAAQATLKRALFYGPTTDTNNGVAENFVNGRTIFEKIGTGSTNSQVWTESTWLSKSTANFTNFDIIIFGDEPPASTDATRWDSAIANRAVWSAAVNGNVLIFGGDPDNHARTNPVAGATALVQKAVTFGADQSGYAQHVTGLYFALGHGIFGANHDGQWQPDQVPLLLGLGDFRAITPCVGMDETSGCGLVQKSAVKVASNPLLDCLSDSDLGAWPGLEFNVFGSGHQGFYNWPSTFFPFAILTDMATGEGTPGYVGPCSPPSYKFAGRDPLVYVLVRGAFNQLTASPCAQTLTAGQSGQNCTVTATLKTLP